MAMAGHPLSPEALARRALYGIATVRRGIEELALAPTGARPTVMRRELVVAYAEMLRDYRKIAGEQAAASAHGPLRSESARRLWLQVGEQAGACQAMLRDRGYEA
jgi:hypothetical protein